jgi:hypothetical protein
MTSYGCIHYVASNAFGGRIQRLDEYSVNKKGSLDVTSFGDLALFFCEELRPHRCDCRGCKGPPAPAILPAAKALAREVSAATSLPDRLRGLYLIETNFSTNSE